jgi:predicted transposase/invertase (TIGR01784 family)
MKVPKIAHLGYDFMGKEIFANPKNIDTMTIPFIHAVTAIPLRKLKGLVILNPYLSKKHAKDKLGIVDIKIRLTNQEIIHIELQVAKDVDMIKRLLFYLSKMVFEQAKNGKEYKEIKKITSIVILGFNLFKAGYKDGLRDIILYDKLIGDLKFPLRLYILELLKNFDGRKALRPWAALFRARTKGDFRMVKRMGNAAVNLIADEIHALSATDEVREQMEAAELARMDLSSMKSIALDQGMKKGRKEGKKEGLKEGLKEGQQKAELRIALKLLKEDLPLRTIAKTTNLPLAQIKNLKKKL